MNEAEVRIAAAEDELRTLVNEYGTAEIARLARRGVEQEKKTILRKRRDAWIYGIGMNVVKKFGIDLRKAVTEEMIEQLSTLSYDIARKQIVLK